VTRGDLAFLPTAPSPSDDPWCYPVHGGRESGPTKSPVVRVLPHPNFCRGNNVRRLSSSHVSCFQHSPSEKHGNSPGTDQGFTTGNGEVTYSSVLLASGRRTRAPAKPCGPGGGARIGDQGYGTAGACQSLLNAVSIRSRIGGSVTRIPRLRLWSGIRCAPF